MPQLRPIFSTDAAKTYAPFDAGQRRLLSEFVRNVSVLQGSSFFAHPGYQIKIWPQEDGSVRFAVDSPGEEAVRAVMGTFRKLYNENEKGKTSANHALNVLIERAAASGTPEGVEVVKELRAMRKHLFERRKTDARGYILVEGDEPTTPGEIIDLWLNAEYIHGDEEGRALLDESPNLTEIYRMPLHNALRDFCETWGALALVVAAALEATKPKED